MREEWNRRGEPSKRHIDNLLRNGARRGRPNFVSWFYQQSIHDMNMSDDLKQIAKGCHTRVKTYNTYDVNGYRFRTDKYEKGRPNATTINSGLLTIGLGENNETIEYYGYIEEIIELEFQGHRPLTLVLFKCHWFDPAKVKYTPRYGLVEVAHASVLPTYEPFVVAHQATQVYYVPYPCQSEEHLCNNWVAYKVQPIGRLPVPTDQDYDFVPNNEDVQFYQDDGLPGTFVIDLGEGLDMLRDNECEINRDAEQVVNDKDLRFLNGLGLSEANRDDHSDDESTEQGCDDEQVEVLHEELEFDEYF